MKKYLTIICSLLLLCVAIHAAETPPPPRCKTCGKTLTQCEHRGMHPKKQPSKPKPKRNAEASQSGTTASRSNKVTMTANGVSFNMILVDGGTLRMGSSDSEADRDEQPVHRVTLSSYYIGETEVTQALWQAVMGSNPSYFKGSQRPVEQVSWNDCKTFISKLNRLTGKSFRLPTESEWEFAARGGNKSRGYKYSGSNNINDVAWYTDNSGNETYTVKGKRPNELGIYDMSGNVYEWCNDWYGSYSGSSQTNPQGPQSGQNRVYRGGSYYYYARYCRSTNRINRGPGRGSNFLGLRLALSQ